MNAIRRSRLLRRGTPTASAALKNPLAQVDYTTVKSYDRQSPLSKPDRVNNTSGKFAGALASCALFALPMAAVLCTSPLAAQSGPMASGVLQEKLASIKASTAENQRKLHQYTWTETSRITMNGDAKPSREFNCSYGPDGKVQKTPVGATTDAASSGGGGRLRERVVAKKTAEIKDYMQQVGGVISLYVPPNPQKMQAAFENKKVSMERSQGIANLVFKDYALPGDSMTIGFDAATKKISTLKVNSYLDTPQQPVALQVEFSSLPDGTNYPLRTTLDAPAKKLNVANTNTNYRKIGQ